MKYAVYTILLLALLFAVTGCKQTGDEASNIETNTAAAANPAMENQMAAVNVQTVNVDLGEWIITFNPKTANPGDVNFIVKNSGKHNHAFRIRGQGVDQSTKVISAGQMDMFIVTLKAGTYETDCPVTGHPERGMKASFIVK